MTAPFTPTNPTQVITDLIELARTTNLALDDSEEFEGGDGRTHAITGQHFDVVCEAIRRVESLPDDKPGECLGPAQKAEWALRHILTAHSNDVAAPAAAAPTVPEGGPPGSGGWEKHAIEMERQRDYYRQRCDTMAEYQRGDAWYWQGDGGDNLESMSNGMLVVIRADQLRALAARKQGGE